MACGYLPGFSNKPPDKAGHITLHHDNNFTTFLITGLAYNRLMQPSAWVTPWTQRASEHYPEG